VHDGLGVAFQETHLLELITSTALSVEYNDVLVAGDHEETTVWGETHTVDWVLPIQIEQFKAFQLEIASIVIIYLEYLKHAFIIPNYKELAIR
jgi:hypothetical protein